MQSGVLLRQSKYQLIVIVSFAVKPCVSGQCHPVFRINSETVGDAVDVVEIADHLRGDRNLVVVEAMSMQCVNVGFLHLSRTQRQPDGEVTQGEVRFRKTGCAVVENDFLSSIRITGLQTEVPRMRESSVVAIVNVADDRSQQFPASSVQRVA